MGSTTDKPSLRARLAAWLCEPLQDQVNMLCGRVEAMEKLLPQIGQVADANFEALLNDLNAMRDTMAVLATQESRPRVRIVPPGQFVRAAEADQRRRVINGVNS